MRNFAVSIAIGFMAIVMSIGPAQADHYVGACSVELNSVHAAIAGATFYGATGETNRSLMLAKLEAANAKIALLKYSDAIDKLDDISAKATELVNAAKPKLSSESGTVINTAVSSAIGCVGGL